MKTTEKNRNQDIKDQENVVKHLEDTIGDLQQEILNINDDIDDASRLIEVRKQDRVEVLHEINEVKEKLTEALEYLLYLKEGAKTEDEEE